MFDGKKRRNIVGTGGAAPTRKAEYEIPILPGDSSDDLTPSNIKNSRGKNNEKEF